nr:hypothetical protein CFP56_22490 [Quercus suber]
MRTYKAESEALLQTTRINIGEDAFGRGPAGKSQVPGVREPGDRNVGTVGREDHGALSRPRAPQSSKWKAKTFSLFGPQFQRIEAACKQTSQHSLPANGDPNVVDDSRLGP